MLRGQALMKCLVEEPGRLQEREVTRVDTAICHDMYMICVIATLRGCQNKVI